MSFCTKCGTQNSDSSSFCVNCGNPLQSTPAPSNLQPTYNQNNYNYQTRSGQPQSDPNIQRTPVKTDRSLVMYILLSIITFGIYGFVFIHGLAKDTNQMCAEDGDKVGGLAAYIFLSILTCGFYSLYWMYKIQNRLQLNAPRYNVYIAENGTTVLLWYLVGSLLCGIGAFVAMHIIIKSANQVGLAYNARYFYNR